ncbi:hypothetical protein CS022_02445 [Veronia nyctiphanis]|uniref:Solute-binding protein family 5 domain-containing protein n=1 Tax=Veronia nyctiphanis TaxID=1278244 RepID=A0A4Q0YTC8_9GAMM|nr:ABC transporter substrate-binding protein [Veronia nyctiphanis]RXJ74470.1 hypothetical protein CS022_02445 [Veronia nyctiphanis]
MSLFIVPNRAAEVQCGLSQHIFITVFIFSVTFLSPSILAETEELVIALKNKPDTLDPHRFNIGNTTTVTNLIYDSLGVRNGGGVSNSKSIISRMTPIDIQTNTWKLTINKGIKFHNGKELTIDDIIYSLDRIASLRDSPSSYKQYVLPILKHSKIDNYSLCIQFKQGYAEFQGDLERISIIATKGDDPEDEDTFIKNMSWVGTNTYKVTENNLENGYIRLEKFSKNVNVDNAISKIKIVFIHDDELRLKKLRQKEVDVADKLTPRQITSLTTEGFKAFFQSTSRVIFLQLDMFRDKPTYITDRLGNSLPQNPLKDIRVRQALSLAIDREYIISSVMEGSASPAGQIFLKSWPLSSKNLTAKKQDVEMAKTLLKQAGYPDGFKMTIHGPEGRYINDMKVIHSIGKMWSKIGVTTSAEGLPVKEYFERALGKNEFSINLLGWAPTNSGSYTFNNLFLAPDKKRKIGTGNAGRYSNLKLTALLNEAQRTHDEIYRLQLYRRASEIVINDVAIIPLHFQVINWGLSPNIGYFPRPENWRLNLTAFRWTEPE